MTIHIATITIEANDPNRLATFWENLLGYEQVFHPTKSVRLDDPSGLGPTILLQPGSTKPAAQKNRWHFDLRPDDRAQAVERALELGASHLDVGQTSQESWIVMAGPEGNEFCILQTLQDRQQRLG